MHFPFAAIVGQEPMKLALLLNAVDPSVGGVLISGARGSAKSRTARALAGLLPSVETRKGCPYGCGLGDPCIDETCGGPERRPTPFVSLPVGASDDRVTGTLDFERALRAGEKRFEPGLLARAHRGVLYVDEVNLLPDHLVDLLLDVAASGVHVVERDGVSLQHPARFLLVGTMNPEEGELRPQLLDRFGLCVGVEHVTDPVLRAEVAARAIAFDRDPERFVDRYATQETELRERLVEARGRLPEVRVPDLLARAIAERCIAEGVEGLRADITLRKAAMALAALEGRGEVGEEEVERVADLALAHRRGAGAPLSTPPAGGGGNPPPEQGSQGDGEGSRSGDSPERFDPGPPVRAELPPAHPSRGPEPRGAARARTLGARQRGQEGIGSRRGATLRGSFPRGRVREPHLHATLQAAARAREPGESGRGLRVEAHHLRERVRRLPARELHCFVLDTSRSMGLRRRMEGTKAALLGLLESAYRRRTEVALVIFAGAGAQVLLPPTRSVRKAERQVREIRVAGRTPLAAGLAAARRLVEGAQRRDASQAVSVVLVSDGRATAGPPGMDPIRATEAELDRLQATGARLIFVDTEEGRMRLGLMRAWARGHGAPCLELDGLHAGGLRRLGAVG